jgi:hypothetical protein
MQFCETLYCVATAVNLFGSVFAHFRNSLMDLIILYAAYFEKLNGYSEVQQNVLIITVYMFVTNYSQTVRKTFNKLLNFVNKNSMQ